MNNHISPVYVIVLVAVIMIGAFCPKPAEAQTLDQSTLDLVSGTINGQNIAPKHRTITVAPGDAITGSFTVSINSYWYPEDVMVMGVTPNWGEPATSFTALGGFSNPAVGLQRTINLNLTAPTALGTYYIIAAYNATFTAAQVMSDTNWSAGHALGFGRDWADWNTGYAIAKWSASNIDTANSKGFFWATCLGSTGPNETPPVVYTPCNVPATAIEVDVSIGPSPSPPPCIAQGTTPDLSASISVASNREWTPTNINVTRGQIITVRATNEVIFSDHDPPTGPDGAGTPCYPNPAIHHWTFPAQNLSCHSLIGRIADGPPFEVGRYFYGLAPASGRLDLGVNDNWFPDNHGDWSVTISVSNR